MNNSTQDKNVSSYPVTEAQLEVWLLSQVSDEANCAFNEIATLRLTGDVDVDALHQALEQVVQRHGLLQATINEELRAIQINSDVKPKVINSDWSTFSVEDQQQRHEELIKQEGTTPFDLANGPLFRVHILKLNEHEYQLTFTAHHVIMDGWSLWVFCRDLGHLYSSELGLSAELPEADVYAEYAAKMEEYHASNEGMTDEKFWVEQFSESIPVLDLPSDRVRPALKTFVAGRVSHSIDAELVAEIRKIGAKKGCSLFNTMLAGFQAFLSRITNQEDIVVGIPSAGQAAMGQENLLGHCVNSLPVRQSVKSSESMSAFMQQVRSTMMDALDHQKYTFGSMLRKIAPPRDPSRPPIFSLMFNVDPAINTGELGFGDLSVAIDIEPRAFENFELFINGVIQADSSVEFQVQFNTQLFDAQTVSEYFESYEALLRSFVATPEARIKDLSLLTTRQKQLQIVDWNRTELDYPIDSCAHHEVEKQSQRTPDAVAVVFGDSTLTYQELDKQSNQVARYLQDEGISSGDLVGVCLERSQQMLVVLLGIWKAGAGYVPMDPAYPTERLAYMCEQSQLKLVITQSELVDRVAAFEKPTLSIDQADTVKSQSDKPVACTVAAEDTAYVIYTSGSTGKPKGVQVPHGAVLNFLFSMREQPGFTQDDTLLAVTTLSFDIAVLELYLPLLVGGTVVIADTAAASDGFKIIDAINEHNVSVLQATPATWRMLIAAGWEGHDRLKVLCGGEPMPADLVRPLLDRCGQLWNMYGPTETTVWSAAFQIEDPDAPILIGKPIGNTQIYILDESLQPVPTAVPGEVYIGGAGVTLGYLHQAELTEERFVSNPYFDPFADYVSSRLYKTGDLARFCSDGNLEFLRRIDKQVKVRGYRIELEEIENALSNYSAIKQCVVIVREDTPGDTRLVAYFIPHDSENVTASDLRKHLRQTLPAYMIPQQFIELEAFPQTDNGKIAYKELPNPDSTSANEVDFIPPETDEEVFVAMAWQEVLEVDSVSVNDNFFDIGGHSLLVMQVISRIEKQFGVRVSPQDFLMGTLETLANQIGDESAGGLQPEVTSTENASPGGVVASEEKAGTFDRLRSFLKSERD